MLNGFFFPKAQTLQRMSLFLYNEETNYNGQKN